MTAIDPAAVTRRPRVATAWLGGCSGCHMSFLDLDERLIELAGKIDLVYSPIADVKVFPADVDVTLVEGAVTNDENEHAARTIRRNSRFVVSFGDCATAGNVTAMRNRFTREELLHRAYVDLARGEVPTIPNDTTLAKLLVRARPLHEFVPVDAFLHGCPPSADEIWLAVSALVEGRPLELPVAYQRYG
jgi:NAD-reducing hydrogenase small subunit